MKRTSALARLTPSDQYRLLALAEYELANKPTGAASRWLERARPEQLAPDRAHRTWLILAGRAWGKTTTGSHGVNLAVRQGRAHRIAVVAPTLADVIDLCMRALREAAGPEAIFSASGHPRLRWPNGAEAMGFSAEDPDSLCGYESDFAWSDELAAWRYPEEAFHQLQFGLRAPGARQIVTTTPRPIPLIKAIMTDPTTVVTRGSTFDNAANLDPATLRYFEARFAGTRLGRQELDGEFLDDVEGALWNRGAIDAHRVSAAPDLVRVVVALDPAVSSAENADETGLIVAAKGIDGHGYVLADLSGRYSPDGWARRAVGAFRSWGADRIVAEVNNGGDLVQETLRTVDPVIPFRAVRASRGKRARAEPVAALYEQGRVHHVGSFPALEDELCAALPEGGSGPDDRLDGLVWAFAELGPGQEGPQAGTRDGEALGRRVWWCQQCDSGFQWDAGRLCPVCLFPAPETFDTALLRPPREQPRWPSEPPMNALVSARWRRR